MKFETNRDKGHAGIALAIAYFGANGYTVSVPLNDTQWYDLIIEKDGVFETVQCKATGSKTGAINLNSAGGTKGAVYDSVLNHNTTWLFCIDEDKHLFKIPLQDVKDSGNIKSISLRTTPTKNNQGFQTYKYLVQI